MAQVTSPIILDSTGQQIHSDLQQIKNVLTTPSAAADITFDNTGTGMQADDVQDAITELKSNLTDLETIEVLYNQDNITFTRIGKLYQLRCYGASRTNFATALNTIKNYIPSNLEDTAFTISNGIYYLAYIVVTGGTNFDVYVTGTYGNTPVNFFTQTSTHSLYCNVMWVK